MESLVGTEAMCNELQKIVKEYNLAAQKISDLTAKKVVKCTKLKRFFVITSYDLPSELLAKVFEKIGQSRYIFEYSANQQVVIFKIYLTN
jgi:hypothetical protein